VRVIVDASGEEAKPFVEAVVLGPAALGEAEVPLAEHRRLVAELLECGREGGHFRRQAGRGSMSGQYGPHPGIARITPGQQ